MDGGVAYNAGCRLFGRHIVRVRFQLSEVYLKVQQEHYWQPNDV